MRVFVNGFSEDELIGRINRCGSRSIVAKEGDSQNVFFGDTYGTEISQATNFAGSIRSKITSWISIVSAQSWLSN